MVASSCVWPSPPPGPGDNAAASLVFNLQVCALTIFAAKDRNPSIFSYAGKSLSKQPAYCPQSKSTYNGKYCMHNFFWFPFSFFSPQVLQSNNSETNFCSGVNLPRGYFLPWMTITLLRAEVSFCRAILLLFGTDGLSVFSAGNRNANQAFSMMGPRTQTSPLHSDPRGQWFCWILFL